MNTFLVEALRAYIDNLLKSGGAAEEMSKEGFKWDDEFETWIDPSKSRQYPHDTIHDPFIPRDRPWPPGYRLPSGQEAAGEAYLSRKAEGISPNENWSLLIKETRKSQDKYIKKWQKRIGKRVHSRYGRMGGGYLPADISGSLKDDSMKSRILGHRRRPWS